MTTATTERSTLIAVFADRDAANQAIDRLREAGYSYDQIRLVVRGTNSFTENLKSLFTGQSSTTTNSADDWMRIGVPEQDAHNYQSELDAGRSIVLLKAVTNPEQALGLMHQCGAYDIASRLRTAQPPVSRTNYRPNTQPEHSEREAQSRPSEIRDERESQPRSSEIRNEQNVR